MKTYAEFLADFEKLKRDLDAVREYEIKLVADRLVDLLEERGIDAHTLFQVTSARTAHSKKRRPKYFNPETGATWTGQGRTPLWLVGKNLEDFRIQGDEVP